jgi:hypothetical protein
MLFRSALLYVLLSGPGLLSETRAAVDLSPIPSDAKFDGATAKYVSFQAGNTRIDYNSPWPISGQGSRAQLAVPYAGANANIARYVTNTPVAFANDQALTEFLKQFLPTGAENPQFESLIRNPVRISGKESAELIVTYALSGRRIQLSTLVAQREPGNELFVFQVSGGSADFKKVHRAFQSSLYSITGF